MINTIEHEINVYKKVNHCQLCILIQINCFSKQFKFKPFSRFQTWKIGEINLKMSEIKLQLIKKIIQKGVFETILLDVKLIEIKRLSNRKFI